MVSTGILSNATPAVASINTAIGLGRLRQRCGHASSVPIHAKPSIMVGVLALGRPTHKVVICEKNSAGSL